MKSKLRDSLENNTNLPVAKYLCKLYIFFYSQAYLSVPPLR